MWSIINPGEQWAADNLIFSFKIITKQIMLFDGFLNHLDDRVEKYADYKVAFGLLSKNETVDVEIWEFYGKNKIVRWE